MEKPKAKMGRPPKQEDVRTDQVAFYLTPEDREYFYTFAKDAGFASFSQFATSIFERLRIGGLSPLVFLKIGIQLSEFAEKNGCTAKQGGFYFGIRPLPALPDAPIPAKVWKKELTAIRHEFEKQTA